MSDSPIPPARWRRFLDFALRDGVRSDMADELDRLYRHRRASSGRRAADRWYRREVLAFVTLVPLASLGRTLARSIKWEGGMGDLGRDIRRAVRSLVREPGFTVMAVATLTLGIGANTVIFSVVDHVVLRPLPYADADRLVSVWEGAQRAEVEMIREDTRTLDRVAGYLETEGFNLTLTDGGVRVSGALIDAHLLPVLGVETAVGRGFTPEDVSRGSDDVALISHGFWMDRFGGDPSMIGQSIVVDGRALRMVGVLPAGFAFPSVGLDVYLPMVDDPSDLQLMWGRGGYQVIGRMAPDADPEQVRVDLLRTAERSRLENPFWTPNEGYRAQSPVVRLQDKLVGDVRGTLLVLLGAVGLVLLVACANVANLLLTRGLGRGRDVAVRTALGASRRRIIREHMIESMLLALTGCVAALVIAQWGLSVLVRFMPPEIPRTGAITLDLRVVAVGVGLAVVAGTLAGFLPAFKSSRADPGLVLREGGRGGSVSSARRRITSAMVVAQMAVAVVLVVGAGLLVRSLGQLNSVDPGFQSTGLTTARLTLVGSGYDDGPSRIAFLERVIERIESVPGVASASVANRVPFGDGWEAMATFIDGVTEDPNSLPVLERYRVLPGFTETLGLRVTAGRSITSADGPDSPLVAVVDQTAADRFWPGEDPVGRRIRWPWRGAEWVEVVGVVTGIAGRDLSTAREPTLYVPMQQTPGPDATVVVRASRADMALAAPLRATIRELDPRVPISSVAAMDDLIAESLARARWTTWLLGMFAVSTLLLGCIGVYGVVSYSVKERTKEIGVRVALGAPPERIRGQVLADGLRLSLPGAAIGVALAIPAARTLEGLLYGVSATDPVTFVAVPLLLLGAGVLAVFVPARRATRVDPVEALRSEA